MVRGPGSGRGEPPPGGNRGNEPPSSPPEEPVRLKTADEKWAELMRRIKPSPFSADEIRDHLVAAFGDERVQLDVFASHGLRHFVEIHTARALSPLGSSEVRVAGFASDATGGEGVCRMVLELRFDKTTFPENLACWFTIFVTRDTTDARYLVASWPSAGTGGGNDILLAWVLEELLCALRGWSVDLLCADVGSQQADYEGRGFEELESGDSGNSMVLRVAEEHGGVRYLDAVRSVYKGFAAFDAWERPIRVRAAPPQNAAPSPSPIGS